MFEVICTVDLANTLFRVDLKYLFNDKVTDLLFIRDKDESVPLRSCCQDLLIDLSTWSQNKRKGENFFKAERASWSI
jgi:hypothetical protein